MSHPDFRVGEKVFAALAYPGKTYGMVKLPLLDQDRFVQEWPEVFTPVPGYWRKDGATHVHLKKATKESAAAGIESSMAQYRADPVDEEFLIWFILENIKAVSSLRSE